MFNDEFYCQTIREWEDQIIPERVRSAKIAWAARLLPMMILTGVAFAGQSIPSWLAILAITYVVAKLFAFCEELNENIRFVRHQMGAFREGVHDAAETLRRYDGRPASEMIEVFNQAWEIPK